jgi:hypothetical protein
VELELEFVDIFKSNLKQVGNNKLGPQQKKATHVRLGKKNISDLLYTLL